MTTRICFMLLAVVLALLPACAFSRDKIWDYTITASAKGAEDAALDAATADAKRQAVCRAAEAWLNRDCLAAGEKALQEFIYARPEAFIDEWKLKDHSYREGTAEVRLDVRVNATALREAIDDMALRLSVTGKPRVLVVIAQLAPGDDPLQADRQIAASLFERGFTLVDARQAEEAQYRDEIRLLRERKYKEADALALQPIADVVVVGTARIRLTDEAAALGTDTVVYGCEAWVDADAVSTDTGRVIATARGATAKPVAGFRRNNVIADAVNAAADAWLRKALSALILDAVDPAKTYTLRVTKCSAADADRIADALLALPYVRAVRLQSLDAKMAEFAVEYLGDAKALVADLNGLKRPGVRVEEITGLVIRAAARR